MALIECPECHKEISSEARSCPSCGMRRGSSPVAKVFLLAVAAGVVILVIAAAAGSGNGSSSSYTKADLCDQSAEAAHYIAAMSASSNDVVRVTDQAIADRKYPALGDKVTASIGAVVALSRGQKTPDEISASVKARCEE
jgi:hypothetical protein